MWKIHTEKSSVSARRVASHSHAYAERWPQVQICPVKITFELLRNNWFVSTETNSMNCLDTFEYKNKMFLISESQLP